MERAPTRVGQEYPLRSGGRKTMEGRTFKVSECQAVRFASDLQESFIYFYFLRREGNGIKGLLYFRKVNLAVMGSEETTVVTLCKAVQK